MYQTSVEEIPGGFRVDGIPYELGRGVPGAPGTMEQNNCLIDSLRQCLGDGLGSEFICDRTLVRRDLQQAFAAAGVDQVSHSSYLDVNAHGMEILRSLFAHTVSHSHIAFDRNDFCIIAIRREEIRHGAEPTGTLGAPHRLVVMNTRNNTHFDPLLRQRAHASTA